MFIDDGHEGAFVEANVENDSSVRNSPCATELLITRIATGSQGLRFRMKVSAFNEIGLTDSPIISTVLASVPDAPPIPVFVASSSSSSKITIDISDFPSSSNGGSEILSFEVQWAEGRAGSFVSLVGATSPFTATTYSKSSDVVKGTTYRFRYRAANIRGFGDFSPELTVLAASVPQAPPKPQLISVDSTSIHLSLMPSADNGGSLVTDYQLWIDGGSSSTAFTQFTAYVYSSSGFDHTIDVASSSLTVGLVYRFTYLAINSVGPSDFSGELSVPLADVPAKPTSLTLSPVSKTSVEVNWIASVSTGSPAGDIKGYIVYRDDGLSGDFTKIFDGSTKATVRSLISSSLITGRFYKFAHSALNSVGSSSTSTAVGIYA